MLFAVETGEAMAYAGLGSVASIVIAAVVAGIIKIMTAQHTNSTDVRVWSLGEAQKIIARQDVRLEALETAEERCKHDLAEANQFKTVLVEWIGWAQPEMEKAGIRVPKFNLADSRTHQSLPEKKEPPK